MKLIAKGNPGSSASEWLGKKWPQFDSLSEHGKLESLAPAIGGKERLRMKRYGRANRDQDMPIGKLTVIPDFLPPPEKLVPREISVKITLKLDANTVRFFKAAANKHRMKYQRMMREVLNGYARKFDSE